MDLELLESEERHPSVARLRPVAVGQIEQWRSELDGYYETIKEFTQMEPDEVLLHLSSFSARMNEIRCQVVRNESRKAQLFRTKELDPFLALLEFQFKIFSRLVAIRQADWEMARGQ